MRLARTRLLLYTATTSSDHSTGTNPAARTSLGLPGPPNRLVLMSLLRTSDVAISLFYYRIIVYSIGYLDSQITLLCNRFEQFVLIGLTFILLWVTDP